MVVAVTSTVPAALAGVIAVIDEVELIVKLAAGVPPKLMAVEAMKLVPVMVTTVPPVVEPSLGDTVVMVGAKVN